MFAWSNLSAAGEDAGAGAVMCTHGACCEERACVRIDAGAASALAPEFLAKLVLGQGWIAALWHEHHDWLL